MSRGEWRARMSLTLARASSRDSPVLPSLVGATMASYPYMSGQFLSMQTLPTRARWPASLHTSPSTW